MKYTINQVRDNDTTYVALFAEHGFEGKGNFCGWYGAEFYTDARMIAFAKEREPRKIYKIATRYTKKYKYGVA